MRSTVFVPSSVAKCCCSAFVLLCACSSPANGFSTPAMALNANRGLLVQKTRRWTSSSASLSMQPSKSSNVQGKERNIDLAAFTESASYASGNLRDATSGILDASFLEQSLLPVLSTSLLITGNTVGASMLVLPELAAGPGMAISSGVLVVAYAMNWLSGLCIAQVAIRQHETSGDEVPSSFKEFAQENLSFPYAAAIVSGISIFVNSLVMAFDTTKAGQVLETAMGDGAGGAANGMAFIWAATMLGLVSTQSLARLSQFASVLVVGLFVTFSGLILPGLSHVVDPLAVLTSGPVSTMDVDVMESVLHMAPVFVTTLVFQNIVPTVTRILGYDRSKVVSAITLGSILPLVIYEAWCVAVLGGGISTTSSDLFTLFSIVTVAGSSIGALMSLSEEFEIILGQEKKDTFSFPSVAIPSIVGLGVCHMFADDISRALEMAGSYGSPLLYGLIPVAMAHVQQQRQPMVPPAFSTIASPGSSGTRSSIVPCGLAGLGALGFGSIALVGGELTASFSQFMGGP